MQGIPIAFTENVFWFSNDMTSTLYAFVVMSSSSPLPLVIVMETPFPSSRRISAGSMRVKLVCAPESHRMFPCLYKLSLSSMLAEITGSKASDFSVIDALFALTLASCVRGDGGIGCIPFSFSMHCFRRLKVDNLWSLSALLS